MRLFFAGLAMVWCALLLVSTGVVRISAAGLGVDAIGRISAIHGNVVFSSEKPGRKARLFDVVKENDRLTVGTGSSVRIIYYSTYDEEQVTGKSEVKITRKGTRSLGKKSGKITTVRKSPQAKIAGNPAGRGKEIASFVSKVISLNDARYPLYPVCTALEGQKQTSFTWKTTAKQEIPYYRVSLTDIDTHEKLVDREVVTKSSFTVPDTAGPLTIGSHYSLTVEGFLIDPADGKAEFSEYRVTATNRVFSFTMPSKQAISFVKTEECRIGKLKKGSDEWVSSSLYLLSLYLEYGADDRAARLAQRMGEQAKSKNLFVESPFIRQLIGCYGE